MDPDSGAAACAHRGHGRLKDNLMRKWNWERPAARVLSMLLLAVGMEAQTPEPQPPPTPTDLPRVGVTAAERRLTLADAIALAVQNNLEVEVEKLNVASAETAIRAAQGAFDFRLQARPDYQRLNTPTPNVLQAPSGNFQERNFANRFAYLQPIQRTGGNVNVAWDLGRFSNNNAFAVLNPFVNSRLAVNFTQPLWRYRRTDFFRTEIEVRRRSANIAESELRLRTIDVVSRAEQQYWNLVAARQSVEVTREAERLAAEQLARNERMIASGTLAPVELSASRAELERRRDAFFAAVAQVTEVENALKVLLTPRRADPMWNEQIIPVDVTGPEPREGENLTERMTVALQSRPELEQLSLRQETNELQRRLAQEEIKPQIDLVLGYVNAGLGGAIRRGENPFTASSAAQFTRLNQLSSLAGLPPILPPDFGSIPPEFIGGAADALRQTFNGSFQSLTGGVAFDINPRNRTARANLAQTAITEKRIGVERARLEQAIEAQVRNSIQLLQSARQRIIAARAAEAAARERLESENRLFQTGESTNFLVLTRQNDYLEARLRTVLAQLDYNRAVSRLEQATGVTLNTYNIRLR
jgi:outer membrane protein TolC